jgi:uncharacterized membrane protein
VGEPCDRILIHVRFVALAYGTGVWFEPEPREVFEESGVELRAAAQPVVIFDAEQDAAAERARKPPYVDRVHDVAEVQVPCRRGSKARERTSGQPGGQGSEVEAHRRRC